MCYVLDELATLTPYELTQFIAEFVPSGTGLPTNGAPISNETLRERFLARLAEHPEMHALRLEHEQAEARAAEEQAARAAECAARPAPPAEPAPEPAPEPRYAQNVDKVGGRSWHQVGPGFGGKTYSASEMRRVIEQAGTRV